MKNLLISLLLTVGLASVSLAGAIPGGVRGHYVVTTSTLVVSGSGVLYRIDLGTGNGSDYAVAYDSVAYFPVAISSIAASQHLSPYLMYLGTATSQFSPNTSMDFSGMGGVNFTNGLFLFQSAAVNRAVVYYGKQ